MAQKLETYDFTTRGTSKYPWSEWANGDIWEVKRGEDFQVKRDSFRSVLKVYATRNKLKLRTSSKDENTLVFQFVKEDQ